MNYELAKQLKDAGFPQMGKGEFADTSDDTIERGTVTLSYLPTLSELIEACGPRDEGFAITYKHTFINWRAFKFINNQKFQGDGATLEEAVAKLWISLHPKA